MKLTKEYTNKIIKIFIVSILCLNITLSIYIHITSFKIFATIFVDTMEETKQKAKEFTESVNSFVSTLLLNYITKLKLISKHTLLFNGKNNSKENEAINKNSKIFSGKNFGERIIPAVTTEILKNPAFQKIYNTSTQSFEYIKYYDKLFSNVSDNNKILSQLNKEHDELNYIAYHNISGQTNLNNLEEATKKKLYFMIPILKTIFLQRLIAMKSKMDIIRIFILNEKEYIIYPPEYSYNTTLAQFYYVHSQSNCSQQLRGGNYFLCAYKYIFNKLFKGFKFQRFFIETAKYDNLICSVCIRFSFMKEEPKKSLLCIEIDLGRVVKSLPYINSKNINFGFYYLIDIDTYIPLGGTYYHYQLEDIFIIYDNAQNIYDELQETYNSTETTSYNYVLDDNDPKKVLKYYSLYHFLYFNLTKLIKAYPKLNKSISNIQEEYEIIKRKTFNATDPYKTNTTIFQFNKTSCRKKLLNNDYECFTEEAEMNVIPLFQKLNILNEDLVDTSEEYTTPNEFYIFVIIYTNYKTNTKDFISLLTTKLKRTISLYLFLSLIILFIIILFIDIFSLHSLGYIDSTINSLNEILAKNDTNKIDILNENLNRKYNKEMISINNIYDIIRKSLIIKESFNNELFLQKHKLEFYKIVQDIKDTKIKEICNSFLGIFHFNNKKYSLSETEFHSVINFIRISERKIKMDEEYEKIKDEIKRSSITAYLNEYSKFENVDENMLIIIYLNIYKQRLIYLYAMNKYNLGNEITNKKEKKNKEKREQYFKDAIKYFEESNEINELVGINQIKNIYSLIMISKCYLQLNDYKNSIININNALSLYFNFSQTFIVSHSKYYNPRIMLFVETNIFHYILYNFSIICSTFNKPCASNFFILKIFEISPFILNNVHYQAGINLLNFFEKNKTKMNKYENKFYKDLIWIKEYEKIKKKFQKIVSRLLIKNINEKKIKKINYKITDSKRTNNSTNKQTNVESILDKSKNSTNIKSDLFTSKYSNYNNRIMYKDITICLSEKILGKINGPQFKDVLINYLIKYFIYDENDQFSFIQFSTNGKKSLFFQHCPLNEFIIKLHKSKYVFTSSNDISNKSDVFMGLYDIFDSVIKNIQTLELNDNIIILFISSEDIRFSNIADCMYIVEQLNKKNISVYFICFDDIIEVSKINNIQSFLNGLIEGYFFQIKNNEQIKEIFVNISNIKYQSNFFKFDYESFDHNL